MSARYYDGSEILIKQKGWKTQEDYHLKLNILWVSKTTMQGLKMVFQVVSTLNI